MHRERGGGGSKAKMERSSTASSSKAAATGGLNSNGKDIIINNNNNDNIKDRGNPNNKISSISRSSFPNKKPLSKGEVSVVSETDSEESDVSGSDGEDTSWISWFCSLRGNEFFCEVDENYIQDDFNLCGLSSQVPYYDYALDLILDVESSHGDMFSEEQNEIIESAAEMLYGLIHVRYILTTKGLGAMLEKYKNAEFGRCPRVFCFGQPCLPVGQSDVSRQSNVKIFCPKCEDIYTPQSRFQDTSRPGWSLFWVYISALVPDDLWTPQTTKDITGLHSANLWLQGPQAMTSKSQIRICASEFVSRGYLPLASCNL